IWESKYINDPIKYQTRSIAVQYGCTKYFSEDLIWKTTGARIGTIPIKLTEIIDMIKIDTKHNIEQELKLLKQEFDSFKKSIEEQKKIDTLVTEICTMLSIDSDNNLLKIYNTLVSDSNTNLTDQKEIIKLICGVLDIKYLENNDYIFKNLGIRITVHEPRDVGTTNRTTQGVCKDYPFGKTIRFYVHDGKEAGFSTTDFPIELRNQLQITEDYITNKINELQEKIDNLNLLRKEFELIKEQEKINIL
ncbi:2543_t:CDS:2, partial [Dentiscutata erythropus]